MGRIMAMATEGHHSLVTATGIRLAWSRD